MSVFEQSENSSSVTTGSEGALDLNKLNEQLKNIKNENGEQKYSTLDKALEALLHSQQYIPQLKTELTTKEREIELMKQQLDTSNSVENLLNSFKENETNNTSTTEQKQVATEVDISQLVLKTIEEREKVNIKANNIKTVDNHLVNLYGDKAAEVIRKKASELGVTPKQLAELSETSPAIVINLFKPETNPVVTPLKSGASIGITQPVQTQFEHKNLMRGAKTKDIVDYVSKIKQAVYEKYDIK